MAKSMGIQPSEVDKLSIKSIANLQGLLASHNEDVKNASKVKSR